MTNDYTIRPNRQSERKNYEELWDVVVGKSIKITTCRGQAVAQDVADRLNIDPSALERGLTLKDRQAGTIYVVSRG